MNLSEAIVPELPEVETTICDLKKKVLERTFIDVWLNSPKIIKKPAIFLEFKSQLKGKRILAIWRAGKNIIFDLSGGMSLLIHQKMTGHLLYGKWKMKDGKWMSQETGALRDDPANRFLHLIFWLDNGYQVALSDLRKFAKVELWLTSDLKNSKIIKDLGPDALEQTLSLEKFKEILKKKRGKIKQTLMNQSIIAGIGNIYSDEILFMAGINPFKKANQLQETEVAKMYAAMREILKKAVEYRGTSISDYRTPNGEKGYFSELRKVYQKEGKPCEKCGSIIERVKIGGRSAHFCPNCQKL